MPVNAAWNDISWGIHLIPFSDKVIEVKFVLKFLLVQKSPVQEWQTFTVFQIWKEQTIERCYVNITLKNHILSANISLVVKKHILCQSFLLSFRTNRPFIIFFNSWDWKKELIWKQVLDFATRGSQVLFV